MTLGINQDFSDDLNDWKTHLCVPDDNLEDLDFFPNFSDNLIRSIGVVPTNEHESYCSNDIGEDWLSQDSFGTNRVDSFEEKRVVSQQSSFEEKRVVDSEDSNKAKRVVAQDFFEEQILASNGFSREKVVDSPHSFDDGVSSTPINFSSEQEVERTSTIKVSRKSRKLLSLKRRQCSHCESEKTPQWRMGPYGPKTLCNACGVRYKSGRLVEVYRPAASPTFDSNKHSNFHKKITQKKLSGRK